MAQIVAQDAAILAELHKEVSFQIDVRFGIKLDDVLFVRDLLLAILNLPTDYRVHLAERLLTEPPVDEMRNMLPLVMFFKTNEDRLQAIQVLQEAPGVIRIDDQQKGNDNGNEEQPGNV